MTLLASLGIPTPLAEAIAGRGYETATPVQVAVLEERCQGHDLLVSSQTGSGKTLAFGVLLAQTLLNETQAAEPPRRGRKPSALIIAPTRELANQVRSELAWLFAKTKLLIAAFTGGSDIGRDLKQLHQGADIVVGTPGRLVDLQNRQALVLGEVRAVVLDEADEMLDMGFREDLQALLDVAAARQRTHMFSATLPRPILGLAAQYQKEAVRVDARAPGDGGAHTDIEHLAHVVAFHDRLAAVINVLRMHAGQKAIVFGTTREGVADLHEALVRQGFRAVVLSGDRAQGERNRAIAALNAGEAQVLVATNVAARGLDLPEVDLVVHADLPLNAESLTHRSGRTGRAGRKGRSVVIADPAERRKAERLLATAKATFAWSPAPTAEAIAEASRRRLEEELLTATLPDDAEEARGLARRLLKEHKKEDLLELLLARELSRCPVGVPLQTVDPKYLARAPRNEPFADLPPRRKRADFERDAVFFRVNLGADQKAEPGWLLPLICRRGGVTRNEVGAIRVGPTSSEFQIAGDAARDFALAASRPDPRAPHVVIESSQVRAPRPQYGGGESTRAPRPQYGGGESTRAPRPQHDGGESTPARAPRPSFGGGESPARAPRPSFGGGEPPARAPRPSFGGGEPPARAPRPSFGGGEPPARAPRPQHGGGESTQARAPRPQHGGGEPPARAPRPQHGGGESPPVRGSHPPRDGVEFIRSRTPRPQYGKPQRSEGRAPLPRWPEQGKPMWKPRPKPGRG